MSFYTLKYFSLLLSTAVFISIFHPEVIKAQEVSNGKKTYVTQVYMYEYPYKVIGLLHEIKDSTLVISKSLVELDYSNDNYYKTSVFATDIEIIKVRGKNSIVKGTIIGFFLGFALGGLIGLAAGDDQPCDYPSISILPIPCVRFTAGQKALMFGLLTSIPGAAIGAATGSISIKIPINGSKATFNQQRKTLQKYSLK